MALNEALPGEPDEHYALLERVRANLNHVIAGKPDIIDLTIVALAAGGSILMEDVPGVGKTTLAKALARTIDGIFSRVQFTPDLLPADILGCSIYNPLDGTFSFRPGPIFCNVLLADEINRASPRTQSALLESMSEMQATIEGTLRPLPRPFFVVATQNPVEYHGTYPLPEAQLDRFMIQLDLGYPADAVEVDILFRHTTSHPLESLQPVLSVERINEVQRRVREVHVERTVAEYVVALTNQTRRDERLKLGVSPRGSLMLFRASQAAAFLDGRPHVLPDDVQRMAPYVLAHRLVLTPKVKYSGVDKAAVVRDILEHVPVPT